MKNKRNGYYIYLRRHFQSKYFGHTCTSDGWNLIHESHEFAREWNHRREN